HGDMNPRLMALMLFFTKGHHQHGMQQDIHALYDVFPFAVFIWIVADTFVGGDEDHSSGSEEAHNLSVVSCVAGEMKGFLNAELLTGLFDTGDNPLRHGGRRHVDD